MHAPKIGQLLHNGKYEIRRHLGSGRFGDVFLAIWHHEDGPQRVAIKWFSKDVLTSRELTSNRGIHQETMLLSSIQHPAIVKILGFETEEESAFLVEEYLAGGNLHQVIDSNNSLKDGSNNQFVDPLKIVTLGLALARGLDVVHGRGYFHGDIKPGNICFRDEAKCEAVFVDFGQGGMSDAALLGRTVVGVAATLAYLPPERTGFVKEMGSGASDLYSLGVSLYEFASGNNLFLANSPKEIITKILCQIPIPLSQVVPQFPEPLSAVIDKLTRKNPSDRYQTAAGLVADLLICYDSLSKQKSIPHFALGRRDKIRELNYKIPMVGRAEELEHMSQLLDSTLKEHGKAILIGAPSGSGKSRLAAEFSKQARSFGMRILSTKFSEFERNVPFSAIGVALQEYAEWLRAQPEEIKFKWKQKVQGVLKEKGQLLLRRLDYFADLFPAFPPIQKMPKEDEINLYYDGLALFFTCLDVGSSGIVIFLDDLQWADFESLEIVRRIVDSEKKDKLGRTLFLGTYRSEEVPAEHFLNIKVLSFLTVAQKIILGPLSKHESDQLVGYLIDESGDEVDKLKKTTYSLTNGNPFFIYEYLKSAISSGVFSLNNTGTAWHFNESMASTMAMTRGAAGLVAERLTRLSRPCFEVLLSASALGSTVDLLPLKMVVFNRIRHLLHEAPYSKANDSFAPWLSAGEFNYEKFLEYALDTLKREHLIIISGNSFSFFHDKIREAAYEFLSEEERRPLHYSYADYLVPGYLEREKTSNKIPSKEIFEMAFHVMASKSDESEIQFREFLYLAGQRAVEVFSFGKAREYLSAAAGMFDAKLIESKFDRADSEHWIAIHELLADSLALSEQLESALSLYATLLNKIEDKEHKSIIYAKISEYNLALFRYPESVNAGMNGLKLLNTPYLLSDLQSILYIIKNIPKLSFMFLKLKMFGNKFNCDESYESEIRFRLFVALQPACFFSKPLSAIANQITFTYPLLLKKDSYFRTMMVMYWGVVAATLGFAKLSRICFSAGADYLDRFPNPVAKGFMNFVWGYLLDFPHGHLEEARTKLNFAFESLASVGESFWRSLSLQGLVHIDLFGGGTGESDECSKQLIALWERVKFEPTSLSCVMKNFLFLGNYKEVDKWLHINLDAGIKIRNQGYETIDYCYANLGPGEIYLLRGEYEAALPLLKEAFRVHLVGFHRVAYCTYSPIPLASVYIRLGRPFTALVPLVFAWINVLINARVFLPQTLYVTAELLAKIKLVRLARFVFEKGLSIAKRHLWATTVAEGRLGLGKILLEHKPEYAESLIERAKSYYIERDQVYLVSECEKYFKGNSVGVKSYRGQLTGFGLTGDNLSEMPSVIQMMASEKLIEIFTKLSAITALDPLLQAALEAFCQCTGADIAIVFIRIESKWVPFKAIGTELSQSGTDFSAEVDHFFVEQTVFSNALKPVIRAKVLQNSADRPGGSVFVFPLSHNQGVAGYCYLGNIASKDLFNENSIAVVAPISAQAAIALQNISLLENTREKAKVDAELKATKAVQEALLPIQGTTLPRMSIAHRYQSATTAGGDWLAYYFSEVTNRAYLCVGDVTGHGFPSALITGVVCGAVFSSEYVTEALDVKTQLSAEKHLNLIAKAANEALVRTGYRTGRLMTMCFISLDVTTGDVAYINAGHVPPLLIQKTPGNLISLTNPSNHLGYSVQSEFQVKSFRISAGDTLCIYSDGLLENTGPSAQVLKSKQIKKILEAHQNVEDACNAIIEEGQKIWLDTPFADDVSLLVAKWNGPVELNDISTIAS